MNYNTTTDTFEFKFQSVPYKINIPGGFNKGRKLFLSLIPDDDMFSVNFMVGEDYGFHFNPRFSKKVTFFHPLHLGTICFLFFIIVAYCKQ